MRFHVVEYPEKPRFEGKNLCLLVTDAWNDFGFCTLFHLYYLDSNGYRRTIGGIKIYKRGAGQIHTKLKSTFTKLGKSYVSLGDGQKFYENLVALGDERAKEILECLRDAAWDEEIYHAFANEDGMRTSLLRTVSALERRKFSAIAHRRAVLSPFNFTYSAAESFATMQFEVSPDSFPPTNVHAIIGRNGVDKTRVLAKFINILCNGRGNKDSNGTIEFRSLKVDEYEHDGSFANVVSVAFSAFDEIQLPDERNKRSGVPLIYIGLRRPRTLAASDDRAKLLKSSRARTQLKSDAELSREFVNSLEACLTSAQDQGWLRAIRILSSDPIFQSMALEQLASLEVEERKKEGARVFKRASSGHKIVLLSITRLVQTVSERTLVLIDEPEAHLHPPLQAAFIRCLSDLLIQRNGVAILATHSPVMLQEVPHSCVWMMFRDGLDVSYERPQIETFAENVGSLTREVFRIEVTDSGYHTLLAKAVEEAQSVDAVFDRFGDQIGSEGRAITRVLWRQKANV
jgi:ABC-type branched-subunit amino acid transport system ATPase component